MSVSYTAVTSGSRISNQHSFKEVFHFRLTLSLESAILLPRIYWTRIPSRKKTLPLLAMNWFGRYFPKRSEDVPLLRTHSPLLFSLMSSEGGHFVSNLRSHGPARPVVKQPVRGASSRTAITAIIQIGGDWSTGLFSVCRDRRICFCGLFCPMCLECDIARYYGECLCWPLLPGSTFAMRIGTRERYKIQDAKCGTNV
ncbi:PREDICTED: PLAC8-like protein 1 isoform X2 [Chinchilla lanigera]|uniref:PLAC8-like protein 1 isoform X2 n=1 Tax=Chinchilla lanigera TaxID=34839 RepID=UPI00038EDD09|nr:PREDICTED: PLAC8-like protein 1 isoform X2 [Chinchilla lanigera]